MRESKSYAITCTIAEHASPVQCPVLGKGDAALGVPIGGLGVLVLACQEDNVVLHGKFGDEPEPVRQALMMASAWSLLTGTLAETEGMPRSLRHLFLEMRALGSKAIRGAVDDANILEKMGITLPAVLRKKDEGTTLWRRIHEDGRRESATGEVPEIWAEIVDPPAPPGPYVKYMVGQGWSYVPNTGATDD